jgi:hypothetical protein
MDDQVHARLVQAGGNRRAQAPSAARYQCNLVLEGIVLHYPRSAPQTRST